MNIQNRFSLTPTDIKKWAYNAALFFAPAFLASLVVIKSGGTTAEAYLVLKMWCLNTAIDLTRKFIAEK